MLAAIRSVAVLGIHAYDVLVEVDVALGLPQWTIVGLPAGAVKESRERVSAALLNSGFVVPPRRITINLAPADVRKEGSAFDLPLAIGILVATGQLESRLLHSCLFAGELGLDGALRGVRGALPIARLAVTRPGTILVVPPPNAAEASLVSDLAIGAPASLDQLVAQLRCGELASGRAMRERAASPDERNDFSDVIGQESAKRAMEVAAAGGHNLILIGPPGAGKTMLARRLPGILPPLSEAEALEVTSVHSVAGLLPAATPLLGTRPFRAPHHSISDAGLIGGGSPPRPGEVSLAHHGVLFLDELLEFRRHVVEALRQPMEDGEVVIARVSASVRFPARFTLIGAMNPCPCGHLGDPTCACSCAAADIARYRARLSGPLSDRLDMHVHVGAVGVRALGERRTGESSATIRQRVAAARRAQGERFARCSGVSCNAHVTGRWLDAQGAIEPSARELLARAAERLALTARGYHRVLRVARTIADLDGTPGVTEQHVAEAIRYRRPPAEQGRGGG
ncbi:MAG: YifB family Mg chelatase-like AAA ATPase [Gemmatimonadota bacterium]|nr:YifB family Mg chelatase-like AAA ATPase [Gemmatimonadota bacterium]